RHHHDREDDARREHRGTVDRPLEEGEEAQRGPEKRERRLPEDRDQEVDPPEAVHHARNGGEELDHEGDRAPDRGGRELGKEDRHAERERYREEESQEGREQRAEDERQRAELIRDRVPGGGSEEAGPELADRELRPPHQLP